MNTQANLPALVAGGHVGAIIPQSVEDIWRLSKIVVEAKLAPQALVKDKDANEACSAVATVLMSGAELGLPPMVSLRSFTVIGGRPALFGDGLINVCRRSGRAEYINTGFDEDRQAGYCAAKRSDNSEEKTAYFSIDDAKRAGLWDEREKVERYNKTVPNDAPWHRYPRRMLAWRAAGYCLRELFADVLGGMPTEDEAREIAAREEYTPIAPPAPPADIVDAEVIKEPKNDGPVSFAEVTVDADSGPPAPPSGVELPDPQELVDKADEWFDRCKTLDELDEAFDNFKGLHRTDMDEENWGLIEACKHGHQDRIQPNPLSGG